MLQRTPFISIALLSAGSLAYEILLMRLFSIIQWHHFAYMIIALALLGYGLSGTLISIVHRRDLLRFNFLYISCVVLFALSAVICFQIAQHIPFNAEEILWDKRQLVYLFSNFLILMVPFFFAASGICLSFIQFKSQVSSIYAVDLIGAGLGSLAVIGALFVLSPQWVLIGIGVLGLATATIAVIELNNRYKLQLSLGLAFTTVFLIIAGQSFDLNISPYKGLSQALRVSSTEVITERSSPLGLIHVIKNNRIPLRHAPGLSLNSTAEPLSQLGVFTDADNMTVITQYPDDMNQLVYLDQMTSALPYHLNTLEKVLVLASGAGIDVLQAKFHKVDIIDAVELNKQIVDLVEQEYEDYSGGLYSKNNISIHIDEARDYITRTEQRYDLIQLALVDGFNASASGLYALNESYLYTIEALEAYYDGLKPGGYLAITRWLKLPPRDTLKLFVTAIDALKRAGVNEPGNHLAMIRSWQTSTLLVKKGLFSTDEVERISQFCQHRMFDLAYAPGIGPDKSNRYNVLDQPYLFDAATSLLSEQRKVYLDRYKYKLDPATDDRPYFNHFLKWSSLFEMFDLRDRGGVSLIEWGYIVLLASLVVAVVLSLVLILIPLYLFGTKKDQLRVIKSNHVILYFLAIGLAFLFMEIAFIQKFFQFLHHPLYSVTTILTSFLIFSGLGSQWSIKVFSSYQLRKKIFFISLMIALISLIYIFLLNHVFYTFSSLSVFYKLMISIVLIAPLAFLMGMPFPLALGIVADYERQLIPWAWGINGAASVVSAILATLLAIHYGFTIVILLAALLYLCIGFVFPEPIKE